jgi:hypothetical protein
MRVSLANAAAVILAPAVVVYGAWIAIILV